MKKIFSLVFLIGLVVSAVAQNGDGSSGNPFYGTIYSSVQWSLGNPIYGSTVYVGRSSNPDLTIDNNGHLTIDPGITVVFTEPSSDLIITGSGILTAVGTSADSIVFTKASANSHWGHITFETPGSGTPISGTGSFAYCRVEYGYAVTSGTDPSNAGGGIQVNATDVTIYNSLFKNNYSNFGGAVTVNANRNTAIKQCRFKSNSSNEAGGALLLWTGTSSIVENCIFEQNHSTGTSSSIYSGGAIWVYANTSKIMNCTFVNNTSDHPGDAIYSLSSSSSIILNSIFCGSANQFASNITSYNVSYCAFETSKPLYSTNSIILDSGNGGNGPNFTDPSTSDYSIIYISPCRDAGASTGAPLTDYLGNGRVGPYDIGAYEVQYNRWNGTANDNLWTNSSNWDGNVNPATGEGHVYIPGGLTTYPTGSSPDFTINSGKNMILEPGAQATFGTLSNNGTLNLQADATSMSSLILNNTGVTANIDLYLSGGGGSPNYKWHYISTPISYLNVSTFAPSFTENIAGWYDNLVTGTLVSGWVAFDGYVYVTKALGGPTFDNFVTGIGYDYYAVADQKYTISGQINTSDVTLNLSYAVDDALHGFNLLGNPFSSGLNWDDIANNVAFPASTSKTIYFTRDNAQCSYVGGVGVPFDVTSIIPPMQGFFVKTNSAGNSITLAAGARSQGAIHARYKGTNIIPLVRLSLTEGSLSDETVVRFDPLAKTNLDYDFDALKMFVSTTSTQIYSALGGTDYSINGQPFPDTLIAIPVVVNLTIDGNHNITVPQLQGLDNYDVTLTDKTTGFTANLKTTPTLSFSASAGTIADRFTLKISKIVTGIENHVVSKNTFNIYPANSMINIQTLSDVWEGKSGSVIVMDLTGKTVGDLNNAEFSKNSLVQVAAPGAKGMYIVEIRSGIMRYVGKIMIR
jgi:hypothetical protein